ncbi:MAG: glycosyltransferase family 2 protein, partial [Candidatus Sungbacteria bacterium]|nr:glycosyltransferase family 2 protein [Candidatus Sungbacteria bacterium]
MMDKIPCSVEILTRNSALTLERCLESVKDFAEIIVLDGNSTDGTLEIARRYGCKIYKQYDTDEPMVVIKDYAEVRDKGLRLATYDWFMYIDSDEYLSPEAVEEIRQIVESPHPPAHAFWQPRKYVFNGKVVECATTYPNKQIRLFHKNYAEGFIKRIHERVKLKEGTKAGVLKGFEYLPVGLLAEMYRRWSRYIKLEEEMIAEESPLKLLRLSFRQALLFFLYSARYLRNLVFCRGVKIPFKYEFIRQGFGAVLSCRLFTRSLMGFLGEKSFWAPLAFTILVTGYSFFGQLGYSVFNADQFFYFPSILRAIHLDALGSDFMAKFSPAAFSFYDELIVGIVRYGGLDIFWTAFLLTVITRFMFFYALYRIARYFTRDTLFSALSLFIFVSGFVVYGTAMRSIADMFLARDLALGFSLLSLSFLFEKRYRTSSLALGLGALLNVGTVVPFAVIFYMITFYEFVASGAKIILSRVISLLLPLLAISALWLYRPEGVSSGLFTALDGVWREILLRRVPNIFVMTWYYPNSSPLYLAVSIYLYFLLWRELPGIFADSEKRRFIRMIFFAPLALTALSVLGGEIFGSAFILQLQLSRSLILWKLFLNLLFVYYAYR